MTFLRKSSIVRQWPEETAEAYWAMRGRKGRQSIWWTKEGMREKGGAGFKRIHTMRRWDPVESTTLAPNVLNDQKSSDVSAQAYLYLLPFSSYLALTLGLFLLRDDRNELEKDEEEDEEDEEDE